MPTSFDLLVSSDAGSGRNPRFTFRFPDGLEMGPYTRAEAWPVIVVLRREAELAARRANEAVSAATGAASIISTFGEDL